MLGELYEALRISVGLTLTVIGTGFLVDAARQRATVAFGVINIATGSSFIFSWFSGFVTLPASIDLFLLIAIVYAMGVATLEITLYVFGDEAHVGSRRRVLAFGALWSVFLWLLPLFDFATGGMRVTSSVEDGRSLALFQAIAYNAVYVWPIAMIVVSLKIARFRIRDIPKDSANVRVIARGLAITLSLLLFIGFGLVLGQRTIYRVGSTLLELALILWYLYIRAKPDTFQKLRAAIDGGHKKRVALELGETEAKTIKERLDAYFLDPSAIADPDLDLQGLAKEIAVPVYRLRAYYTDRMETGFADWLNAARVELACRMLAERRDLSILDIAFQSGFSSKGAFNRQFLLRVGQTPSEFRALKKVTT